MSDQRGETKKCIAEQIVLAALVAVSLGRLLAQTSKVVTTTAEMKRIQ
jgi:hypothetical protein